MKRLVQFAQWVFRKQAGNEPVEPSEQQSEEVEVLLDDPLPSSIGRFDPDNPVSGRAGTDRLGYQAVAKLLASSLTEQVSDHGLVVSIEGPWGSGKSSLVNMLATELKGSERLYVVRFEPWLVGDRDGMLTELMSDLAAAVESIQTSENGGELGAKTRTLAKQLRGYASKLSRHSAAVAHIAGSLGAPAGEAIGKVLEGMSDMATEPNKPLPKVKADLTNGLKELGRRIVVIVDDLDRLEPQEAGEIMRLIKAVADFPNVIYVLCYDPKILAASLKHTLAIDNGSAFLEKIVQVRFGVPHPEAFDLRRWLLEECLGLYVSVTGEPLPDEQKQRLLSVCDIEGSLLKTPRQVVRVLNAVKLYWPPVSAEVSYADLVWLQMVRLTSEDFYEWIERYLTEYAALSEGAQVHETERVAFAKEFLTYTVDASIGSARSMWTLKEFIPGIRIGNSVEHKNRLFHREDEAERKKFENGRYLGSPQHSRYYFAISKPSGALEDRELYSLISKAADGENLEDICIGLVSEHRAQGGTKFDLLLDRIANLDQAALPDAAIPSILMALADCMDVAGAASGSGEWGVRWTWRSAHRLFKDLLAKLAPDDKARLLPQVFSSGKAIGWLMTELIRDEIFAHGRYGERRRRESEWLLSDQELDEAIHHILRRFRSTDRNRIIDTPEVLSLMYGWSQAGDEEGVNAWVQEQLATDAGFLKLLSACRGWLQSDKTYYPLNRRDLKHFMDFDDALARLTGIVEDSDKAEEDRELAKELLQAAEIGEEREHRLGSN